MKNMKFRISYGVIILLLIIIVLDLFLKVEYSSKAITQNLNSINNYIRNISANNAITEIQSKAFINNELININNLINLFLSERSVSFLLTFISVILISFGLYLLSDINRLKNELSTDLEKINNFRNDIVKTQKNDTTELKLINSLNKLRLRHTILKESIIYNPDKKNLENIFNSKLRYILNDELSEIKNHIDVIYANNLNINSFVINLAIDILNEIKTKPFETYRGNIPPDLLKPIVSCLHLIDNIPTR